MNKEKTFIAIFLVIFIVSAVAFCVVMVKMISKNSECVDSPFEYSAQKLEDSGGMYSCYCRSLDMGLLSFSFDKNGIYIDNSSSNNNIIIDIGEPGNGSNSKSINLSLDSIEINLSD